MTAAPDLCFKGEYVEVALEAVWINFPVEIRSEYETPKHRVATLVRAAYRNLWTYRIRVSGIGDEAKLIDSRGNQHRLSQPPDLIGDDQILTKTLKGEMVSVCLPSPELELEPAARTTGWLWFPKLKADILPGRILFAFTIFENDSCSGSVYDEEIIDFVLAGQDLNQVLSLPDIQGGGS